MGLSGGKQIINQLILRYRWPVIGLIGLLIFVLEVFEHPSALQQFDHVFTSEVLFLEGLLFTTGISIGWLVKSIREKTAAVNTLEAKNNLNQQLTKAEDWQHVTELLVEFPGTILPIEGSSLLIYSPQTNNYELTSYWLSDPSIVEPLNHFQANGKCAHCPNRDYFQLQLIDGQCAQKKTRVSQFDCYCLPLTYGGSKGALLHLCIPKNLKLDPDRVNLINNLAPEMAIGLMVAKENIAREKLIAEQSAEFVRRSLTRDMHDSLAQNLAYIQLRLDQLVSDGSNNGSQQIIDQLGRLRDVADESYELVRGTLGALHPNNASRLGDILCQHADSFAERGNFEIEFTQVGTPQSLDPLIMHNIYQLFREALNNVVKHAAAQNVIAKLDWQDEELILSIEDDGRGFDPRIIEQGNHYGISFMQERVKQLNGMMLMESSPSVQTTVTFTIPLEGERDWSDEEG